MVGTLAEQLQDMKEVSDAEKYPYVRRDKLVRARLLAPSGSSHVLIETWYEGCKEPTKRRILTSAFEDNYWEGRD